MKKDIAERFFEKLKKNDNGCLVWTGAKTPNGYGQIRRKYEKISTHRLAYEIKYGEIPKGFCVCHKCDNPSCCNIDHLFLGTHLENMIDKVKKGRAQKLGGELCGRHKLSKEQVLKIRKDTRSGYAIAKDYGVDFGTIYAIIKRKTWKNI